MVGDTVNVASRLERLTRELDVELVVSDAVVRRIREEGSLVGLRLDQQRSTFISVLPFSHFLECMGLFAHVCTPYSKDLAYSHY